MYSEVIMKGGNIEKYFYFIKDLKTYKVFLAPKSKEIFQYYKNIISFGNISFNDKDIYNVWLLSLDTFEEYYSYEKYKGNIVYSTLILTFQFKEEAEAFYFKLKFC